VKKANLDTISFLSYHQTKKSQAYSIGLQHIYTPKGGLDLKPFYKRTQTGISRVLLAKFLVCLCLIAAAYLIRKFGPPEFYDALLYRIDAGPSVDTIIEAFGKFPVDQEAFTYLWTQSVVDVINPVS